MRASSSINCLTSSHCPWVYLLVLWNAHLLENLDVLTLLHTSRKCWARLLDSGEASLRRPAHRHGLILPVTFSPKARSWDLYFFLSNWSSLGPQVCCPIFHWDPEVELGISSEVLYSGSLQCYQLLRIYSDEDHSPENAHAHSLQLPGALTLCVQPSTAASNLL